MDYRKHPFYTVNKKIWAFSSIIYVIFFVIISFLFCMLAIKMNWPLFSLIMIILLSLFIAIFPTSVLSVIMLRKIRRSKLGERKSISIDEFLLRCNSSERLDRKIVICFREILGEILGIDCEKIYPEDTGYELLFPLGFLDSKEAIDSLDVFGLMEKAGRPISMGQADEAIHVLGDLKTVCQKINYLSNISKNKKVGRM